MGPTRVSTRESATPPARTSSGLDRHLDRGFRPDLEGLRALAVIVVIVYHARFLGLGGGFIGVDVFFVVSGFLITRLLLGEVAASGTISLRQFWARRARRLLPASALTVVATLFFAHWMLPPLTQALLVRDAVGAATFSANIVFADRLGDYFGAQLGAATPSPLLHFWSLAVEEQFYLLWPAVMLLLTRRPRQYRRLLLVTIGVLGIVGFVLAAWLTPRQPAWAFYLLPTRMGELLAGAALAVVGAQVRSVPAVWRATAAWCGLAVIAVAAWRFDESMPWPGTAVAVPVLATVAVIAGGDALATTWGPGRLLGRRAPQWIGRHSYALYLWHWPVLVLADARWGPLDGAQRAAAILIAVGLSALSVVYVEDPVRFARPFARHARLSLSLGVTMILVVLASAWGLRASMPRLDSGTVAAAPQLVIVGAAGDGSAPTTALDATSPAAAPPAVAASTANSTSTVVTSTTPSSSSSTTPTTSTAPPSVTAPAVTPPSPTAPPSVAAATTTTLAVPDPPTGALADLTASVQLALADAATPAGVPANLRPSLGAARTRSQLYADGCVNVGVNQRLQPCEYGVGDSEAVIVLYGDSHAVQWFEPLVQIAHDRGFKLIVLAKGGCPVTDVVVPTPVLRHTCPPYRDQALAWIGEHQPNVVIVANSYTQYTDDAVTWATGAEATAKRLAEVAGNVVVLGDTPVSAADPPACLSRHVDDVSACADARTDAVRADRIAGELVAARNHGFTYVDTSDWFCTPTSCPAVVGDLLVRRDETHITAPMAEFLRPLLEAAISPALDRAVEG